MSTSSGRMRRIQYVMSGLDPGIHQIFTKALSKGWFAGSSPAMTRSQGRHALQAIKPPPTGMIAPVRNDAAGRHRLSVMLSDLKSDIECSRKMMSCRARLTRLAPIRREVKPRKIEDRACDEPSRFQPQ